MTFVLSKLFWALAQPLNLIVVLLTFGILIGLIGFRRIANGALWSGIVLLLAISFLPLPSVLLLPLENRFPVPRALPEQIDGIIVLGGAGMSELARARDQVNVNDAGERYLEAFALARRYPQAKVIFTGGSAQIFEGGVSEAELAERLFREQGFPDERILYERQSRNTWENALYSKRMVTPRPGENWILITSAFHMPRSVGIFREVGWPGLIPYPVDFRMAGRFQIIGMNFLLRLTATDIALREWIGLVAYRIMGRTDALFPGP